MRGHGLDAQCEVLTRGMPIEDLQLLVNFGEEVLPNLLADLRLGRRRDADDRSSAASLLLAELSDKAGRVEVVRPEIVAPL
ncbi:MAG: hypothetical protein ACK56I_18200 [bacterium]